MKNIHDVFEKVAKENNKTVTEIRQDMQNAINYAWDNNEKIRKMFKNKPTPEEFVLKSCIEILGESTGASNDGVF